EAVDGLSVPNEKTGLPEATPPILGAVPSAFSSPQTDERAKQPNQRTKDRHRGSVSDGNGVHGGFLWCVEEETEQPATPGGDGGGVVADAIVYCDFPCNLRVVRKILSKKVPNFK
ncbi:hypothetical protein THAOC_29251, partial [Thalassiosira oceanica]